MKMCIEIACGKEHLHLLVHFLSTAFSSLSQTLVQTSLPSSNFLHPAPFLEAIRTDNIVKNIYRDILVVVVLVHVL